MAALINLGGVYAQLGEAEKALEYFDRARGLAVAARDRATVLVALNNAATAYEMLGEPGRALEFFDRGMALCRETNDTRCAASMLVNWGTFSRRLGDHERALRQAEEAAVAARSLSDQSLFGLALVNIGAARKDLGQHDEALARYAEALAVFQKVRNSRGQGLAELQIAEIHRQRHEYGPALKYFEQGLASLQSSGDSRNDAEAHHGIAVVQRALGNTQAAREHLERALAIARATTDVHSEAQTLLSLANLGRDGGELGSAKAHLDAALQLIEGLRGKVSRQPLRTALLAAKQEYYEASIDVLMHLHAEQNASGFDAQALEVSERARARGLLDMLGEAGVNVREGVDPALLERERSLRQLLNGKSDKQVALLSARQTAAALELDREIDDTITALQAVESDIRRRSPRYAALTQPQAVTVADLRGEVLDDETVLIEYSLGPEHSYVWALTKSGLISARLPSRTAVERAARELYDGLTARSRRSPGETAAGWVQRIRKADAELARTADAVSHIVLSPVAEAIAKRRVLIVSDGALSYLPFGMLPDPNASDRRPLLVDHEIVTAPSASVLALLRRESAGRIAPPLTAAVIADPVFEAGDPRVRRPATRTGSRSEPDRSTLRDLERSITELGGGGSMLSLNRLFASRDDARAIRALAPRGQSLEALDFDANLATATSPKLARYAIVHFATHTLLNALHPELSGIVLSLVNEAGDAQPGFLRLHDIYNLQLPIELVVLSACQTALGREIKGEGIVGLSRGFMYAGASRVIVSLWKVGDKATSVLMGHFYREMLRNHRTPAAALRAAQRRMREDADWRNPFHWAGFIIQGEWR
jgi:CHAT domain-containing protein/tetratricopeptide (TPR) repeat protein